MLLRGLEVHYEPTVGRVDGLPTDQRPRSTSKNRIPSRTEAMVHRPIENVRNHRAMRTATVPSLRQLLLPGDDFVTLVAATPEYLKSHVASACPEPCPLGVFSEQTP